MDIFFFITTLVVIILLFFVTIIGLYIFLIVRRIKKITKVVDEFVSEVTTKGLTSIESIKSKIDNIFNTGGFVERMTVTTLGTILAKTFKSRGRIKKDAPKK